MSRIAVAALPVGLLLIAGGIATAQDEPEEPGEAVENEGSGEGPDDELADAEETDEVRPLAAISGEDALLLEALLGADEDWGGALDDVLVDDSYLDEALEADVLIGSGGYGSIVGQGYGGGGLGNSYDDYAEYYDEYYGEGEYGFGVATVSAGSGSDISFEVSAADGALELEGAALTLDRLAYMFAECAYGSDDADIDMALVISDMGYVLSTRILDADDASTDTRNCLMGATPDLYFSEVDAVSNLAFTIHFRSDSD